jgi:hypothetical protein
MIAQLEKKAELEIVYLRLVDLIPVRISRFAITKN